MSAWRETTLGQVCDEVDGIIQTGPFGSQLHESDYSPDGIPVVMPKDIIEGRIATHSVARVSPEHVERLSRHKLRKGDIVYGRRGDIGRQALIRQEQEGWLCGTGCLRLSFGESVLNPLFLHYYLRQDDVVGWITNQAVGATMPNLNTGILRTVPVKFPPLSVQQRIAGILSAYDGLIENSQRRIRILEAMARALYREWFVHFRFPGHENHPRVASPLGDIPAGWLVVNLDSLKEEKPYAINGGPFGSKLVSKDYVGEGVPVIRGSNLSESGRFDPTEFVFVSSKKAEELRANLAKPGDIVVTQRGTLGQIGMIPSGIGYDQFVISQSQMKVTLDPKKVDREFAFFFLRSEEVNQRIKNLASSSGVPHINLAVLREFQILIPPFELQSKFGHFALSTEAAIEALLRQIQNLRRTRDRLLPRLFSGQVEVEAA